MTFTNLELMRHGTTVFTAEQMRELDRRAVEVYGIPSIVLMENAALCVVEFLEANFGPLQGKKGIVFCGTGNNGGDGFAIARHLKARECICELRLVGDANSLKNDALSNYRILENTAEENYKRLPSYIHKRLPKESYEERVKKKRFPIPVWGDEYDFVVDAVLGTGVRGDRKFVDDVYELLLLQERGRVPLIAVDIPSGLSADSGEHVTRTPNADYTVTFVGPKRGMFVREGLRNCGEIWVGEIGAPKPLVQHTDTGSYCITRRFIHRLLPERYLDAHKGSAGRVVVCGGSTGMSGAPALAARAALRVGAGLCIACVPEKVQPVFASSILEATSHPLPCDEEGRFVPEAAGRVLEYSKGAQVLALGPGLSRSEGALDFAREIITQSELPIVVDADALYALRAIEKQLKNRKAPTILTPHPGEMAELLEMSTQDVQNDRVAAAQSCAQKYNVFVVLKGARTIVASPDFKTYNENITGAIWFNLTGNPGMATGGSGDVLTGTIAGLIAQTGSALNSTLLGVYLHGLAGDLVYKEKGNGLIAGDIAEALPRALKFIEEHPEPEQINSRLRKLE